MNNNCWVLLADGVPVAVFTSRMRGIVERLRMCKDQDELQLQTRLKFTLAGPITLMEG